MAYTIWAVAESALTITGASGLDGLTQGDGTHLLGAVITWNGGGWEEILVTDDDPDFHDNDGSQRVTQTVFGTGYTNRVIEAEYTILLRGPDGTEYQAIGVNVNEPGQSPAYGTVEGLAFIGEAPPVGVPLTVVGAGEGPGSSGQPPAPAVTYYAPPCFTAGVMIRMDDGARPVESLRPGDMVWTADGGPKPLRLLLERRIDAAQLAADPSIRPIRLRAGALGPGRPSRDLLVSPQHRVLVSDWRSALHWGASEVLVPARALVDGDRVVVEDGLGEVTYYHLVFDRHEIVESEGLLSESYLPGPLTLGGLSPDQQAAVEGLAHPARPGLSGREAALLAAGPRERSRLD